MIDSSTAISFLGYSLFSDAGPVQHALRKKRAPASPDRIPQSLATNPAETAMAELYAQGLQEGVKTGTVTQTLDNISKDSIFGKWWSHFNDAVTSPTFTTWAKTKKIDLSKPIHIYPGYNQIVCTINGKRETLQGSKQDNSWSAATESLMQAARVVGAQGPGLAAPTSSSSAPFSVVAHFYGEHGFSASPEMQAKRVGELQHNSRFADIPPSDTTRTAQSRSDSALDSANTALRDGQDKQALLEKLQGFPSNGSRRLDEYLKNTTLPVHPQGTYAQLKEAHETNTVSLEAFIGNSGWTVPKNEDELANLIRVLSTPKLPTVRLGNFGGALSWSVPLENDKQKLTYSHVIHNNLRLPGLGDQFRRSGALGYLSHNLHWSTNTMRNPEWIVEQIIDSPKAKALGKALQEKMGALSTTTSNQDWVLAAIATTLDSESVFHPKKNHVAGFNLAADQHYGRPLATIKQGLIDHLSSTRKTTMEMAPVAAHLLLSRVAPELLVKDIPQSVTYGSIAWASLKAAVARIEAQSSGASTRMTFVEVVSRDANDPISAADELIQSQTLKAVLSEWGEINGVLPKIERGNHSSSEIESAQKMMAEKRDLLSQVPAALNTEMPTQKSIALKVLRETFGEHIPFERKCITSHVVTQDSYKLTPSLTTDPVGNYSLLDLYLSGRSNDPVGWTTTDSGVPINDMLSKLSRLAKPDELHIEAFAKYRSGIERAYAISTRNLISQLPLEDRKNLEYGAIKVYVEGEVSRTTNTLPTGTVVHGPHFPEQTLKERALLIKATRNGNDEFYEISPQQGRIRKRDEFKINFKEGVQDQWVVRPSDIGKKEVNRSIEEQKPKTTQDKALRAPQSELSIAPESFTSQRSLYLGELLSKHTTNAFQFDDLFESSKAVTTFDEEEARKRLATEVFLGVIPGASAIRHLIQGKPLEALGDVIFDGVMYATTLGFGKVAGSFKAFKSVKSFGRALAKGAKVGLRRLGGFSSDVAQAAGRGVGATVARVRQGLRNSDVLKIAKRTDVAEGTIKMGNNIDIMKGTAKLDEATGKWFHYDLKTGKSYGLPINFTPDDISSSSLQKNLDILSANPKTDFIDSICYANALLVGSAEKKLSKTAVDTVLRATKEAPGSGTNYTAGYKRLMGITDESPKKALDLGEITESGIVNFKYGHEGGNYFHTAYIHKTDTGEFFLYHSNSFTLDVALSEKNTLPTVVGRSNIYPLDRVRLEKLQQWIVENKHEVVFTKSSVLEANVRAPAA
ncbi:hypothetical protein [Pseudomonas brenneri]